MSTPQPAPIDRRTVRNSAIRTEYQTLVSKRFQTGYIIDTLSAKYYLAPRTIWAILSTKGYYATTTKPGRA